jgi:hypothetical protein
MPHARKKFKERGLTAEDVDKIANSLNWNILGKKQERKYIKNNTEIRFLVRKDIYKTIVYDKGKESNIDTTTNKKEALTYLSEMLLMS